MKSGKNMNPSYVWMNGTEESEEWKEKDKNEERKNDKCNRKRTLDIKRKENGRMNLHPIFRAYVWKEEKHIEKLIKKWREIERKINT